MNTSVACMQCAWYDGVVITQLSILGMAMRCCPQGMCIVDMKARATVWWGAVMKRKKAAATSIFGEGSWTQQPTLSGKLE